MRIVRIAAAGQFPLVARTTATHNIARRHIASFKGEPLDFINEVEGTKAALVYFYTTWCKPCSPFTARLEAIESKKKVTVLSSLSSSLSPPSSSSCSSLTSPTSSTSASSCSAQAREDAEAVFDGTRKACLLFQSSGQAVRIIPVNTDENPKLGALHDVRSVPTFVTYREGRIVGRAEGFSESRIQQLVRDLVQE